MSDQPLSRAKTAAARRALREAAALRANLHRRKQQSRALEATPPEPSPNPPAETPQPCR